MVKKLVPFLLMGSLLAACAEGAGPRAATSGIEGQVVAGPTCPVMTESSPCPPKPIQTVVAIESEDGERLLDVRTDVQGRFRAQLDPGSYLVSAVPPPTDLSLVPKPSRVEVEPNTYAQVTVILDTRIREPVSVG